MYLFEYIYDIYNSLSNTIKELLVDATDLLDKYGGV